ncbi:Oidioi.mRNA.OKI2018_I69.PAR.g10025.t1.cds [Oikopleura dioica]|uniref:Oidioi.mRNA.OKI2018_I69.PAR.g10025.t1.cds n=1 Tax=Oikopleura dioica TaxID=34765 RepID=A0ABN7RSL4_OIKDI|nr:Oidioi.mRNA.OKI2018_I69.PAR.g10025.t1.cds [Oikopleura dioica]
MRISYFFSLLGFVFGEKLKYEETESDRPNIVFAIIDDYGYNDIGYHQDIIKTPNIDAISASGVRLENVSSQDETVVESTVVRTPVRSRHKSECDASKKMPAPPHRERRRTSSDSGALL